MQLANTPRYSYGKMATNFVIALYSETRARIELTVYDDGIAVLTISASLLTPLAISVSVCQAQLSLSPRPDPSAARSLRYPPRKTCCRVQTSDCTSAGLGKPVPRP